MSRGIQSPMLLVALTLPGAAFALGLGDIRVNSALNEPLSAQVDIVGATSDELKSLKVSIADDERFRRFNADRPSYLATVSIRLGTDSQGRPVLNLFSDAAFTDPVVELLVDVRYGGGELIRDYSLLLDPAEFHAAAVRETAPVATAPVATTVSTESPIILLPTVAMPVVHAPAVIVPRTASIVLPTSYRVRPRDTLSHIVRRAGVLDAADAQRMMIALFRDNPDAFDGNINLLHRDALLAMPTLAEISAIDAAQARRDVAGHMSAWRHGAAVQVAREPVGVRTVQAPAPEQVPAPVQFATPAVNPPAMEASTTDAVTSEEAVSAAPAPLVAPSAPERAAEPGTPLLTTLLRFVALPVVALVLAGLALRGLAILMRRRRSVRAPALPAYEPEHVVAAPASPTAGDVRNEESPQQRATDRTMELPTADDNPTVQLQATGDETILMSEPTRLTEDITLGETMEVTAEMAAATGEMTAIMPADLATVILEGMASDDTILDVAALRTELKRAQDTVLDYNLVDLDATAQHVHMPSDLNDRPTFVERRTNVAEALRTAIARDPSRNDLRMKLVETYFAVAATNRRAFAEFLRLQASDPNALTADDWRKIAMMSQELGLDPAVPAQASDDDLANCA